MQEQKNSQHCFEKLAGQIIYLVTARTKSDEAREFYLRLCIKNKYSVRELEYTDLEYIDNISISETIFRISDNCKNLLNFHKLSVKSKQNKLLEYFRKKTDKKFYIIFDKIERIGGFILSKLAYEDSSFWYSKTPTSMYNAWELAGFEISKIDLKNKRILFQKTKSYSSNIEIPSVILNHTVPNKAKFEINKFFNYIVKKYGL